MTGPLDSPWMDVREASAYARSSRAELTDALRDGSLRGSQLKPGGKWRVHRADIDAWLLGEPSPDLTYSYSARKAAS